MSASNVGGVGRLATSTSANATTTNAPSQRPSVHGLSPMSSDADRDDRCELAERARTERANVPKGLSATPASSRIGMSAPIDVVVRTSPIKRSETCQPSCARNAPTNSAAPKEMNHDTVARVKGAPRTRLEVDLVAGHEHQEREAEVGDAADERSRAGPVQHRRPDEDAEDDLDDDDRDAEALEALGEQHRADRRGEDDGERGGRRHAAPIVLHLAHSGTFRARGC